MNNLRHSETALKHAAVIRSLIDDLERKIQILHIDICTEGERVRASIRLTRSTRCWQDRSGPVATILRRRSPISNSVSRLIERAQCRLADEDLAHG